MTTVTAEERVKKLARALCSHDKGWHDIKTAGDGKCHECLDTERVLREAGLVELIEAGQAMRGNPYELSAAFNWDAALERLGKP